MHHPRRSYSRRSLLLMMGAALAVALVVVFVVLHNLSFYTSLARAGATAATKSDDSALSVAHDTAAASSSSSDDSPAADDHHHHHDSHPVETEKKKKKQPINNKSPDAADPDSPQQKLEALADALPHVAFTEKDRVARWVPRVNGPIHAAAGAADVHEREADKDADNDGGDDAASSCEWQLELEQDAESMKKKSKLEQQQRRHRVVLRLCASQDALPLLAEVQSLGIVDALKEDLNFEYQLREQKHGDDEEEDHHQHPTRQQQQQQQNPQHLQSQAEISEKFLSAIDFVFDFQNRRCDILLRPLKVGGRVIFGGVQDPRVHNDDAATAKSDPSSSSSSLGPLFEDETYSLVVAGSSSDKKPFNNNNNLIIISSTSVLGVHHALRTFALHVKENSAVHDRAVSGKPPLFAVPCLKIERDAPVVGWRAQHIDIARHPFSGKFVAEEVLRKMAWAKMNVLHLHASDDQGWRVESAMLPALHLLGGRRGERLNGKSGLNKKFAESRALHAPEFWTREEIFDFVHAARARGIRVMPEVDLPAHASALLLAMEAEVFRFARLVEKEQQEKQEDGESSVAVIEKELRKRLEQRYALPELSEHRRSRHRHIHHDDVADSSSSLTVTSTHLFSKIKSDLIPRAAKSFARAVAFAVDSSPSAANSRLATSGGEAGSWRRSFFGTFFNGNADCQTPAHLQAEELEKNHHQEDEKQRHELFDADWSIPEIATRFFDSSSSNTNNNNAFARSFVSSHSALNCMGGTHAVFDPTSAAADALLLIMAEVSLAFHEPLEFFAASSPPLPSSAAVPSWTFGPCLLFHVGGDQAEALASFAWAPWDGSIVGGGGAQAGLVVDGDEENDAVARDKVVESKIKNKKRGGGGNNNNKSPQHVKVSRSVAAAFSTLARGISAGSSSIGTAGQPALLAYLVEELQKVVGATELRAAVWDETLLDFDAFPMPAGTVTILWRDDGISWNDVAFKLAFLDKQQQKKKQQNHPQDFPIVFGGKSRLYFDYQQHAERSNNKFWPLNVFGPWIPHRAATLERVFLVPEVLPRELLSVCGSMSDLRDPARQSSLRVTSADILSDVGKKNLKFLNVVGVQSGLWSELLVSEAKFKYQLFPRMLATAEVGWATCLSGVTPTVRVVQMDEQHKFAQQQQKSSKKKQQQQQQQQQPSSRLQDRCISEELVDLFSQHDQKQQQQRGGGGARPFSVGDVGGDNNPDDSVFALEARCKEQKYSLPIMKCCKKQKPVGSASTAPIFELWQSKLTCSAQNF